MPQIFTSLAECLDHTSCLKPLNITCCLVREVCSTSVFTLKIKFWTHYTLILIICSLNYIVFIDLVVFLRHFPSRNKICLVITSDYNLYFFYMHPQFFVICGTAGRSQCLSSTRQTNNIDI